MHKDIRLAGMVLVADGQGEGKRTVTVREGGKRIEE